MSARPFTALSIMPSTESYEGFQPTMLGTVIRFEEGGPGMITDENEDAIYIESDYFTGWMSKADFAEQLGVAD